MALRPLSLTRAIAGASLMVLAGALFAVVNTFVQHAVMVQGVPPARLAFWQYAVALAFAVPWLLAKGLAALRTDMPAQHVLRVALAAGGVQLWVGASPTCRSGRRSRSSCSRPSSSRSGRP